MRLLHPDTARFFQKACTAIAFVLFASCNFADIPAQELETLKAECLEGRQRHVTMSPTLQKNACLAINIFNTYANSLQDMNDMFIEVQKLGIRQSEMMRGALDEINYLSSSFQGGKSSIYTKSNKNSAATYTKDLIARNLALVNFLLKRHNSTSLSERLARKIMTTLIYVEKQMGEYLYSYDVMTYQCRLGNPKDPANHCPRLLFMAPVLWTTIAERVNTLSPFPEDLHETLFPIINNMLDAHSQVTVGMPVYIQAYSPETSYSATVEGPDFIYLQAKPGKTHTFDTSPMDKAHDSYVGALSKWHMNKDFHSTTFSESSFKRWGFLPMADDGFQLTLSETLSYAQIAFKAATQSQKRALDILASYGQTPVHAKLVRAPSYQLEMNSGVHNRTASAMAQALSNL